MNRNIQYMIVLCCVAISNNTLAQNKKDLIQRVNISYVFGAQVYNDNFIYNPGIAVEGALGLRLSDDVSMGFGTGYMGLSNENFIPIFIEAIGYHERKGRHRYMKFQGGYSLAWSNDSHTKEDYDIDNGLFFDLALGRHWSINEKLKLSIQTSYRHQFASLHYTAFGSQEFNDVVNFDMIVMSVGLIKL